MYIVIGADLVPTKSNTDLFVNEEICQLIGDDLQELISNASYRIFNLETPLADEETPIIKCGPNLLAPTRTIAGYHALQIDLLTLANNHILDQNVAGLESTIKTLDEANIKHVGAGQNLTKACEPYMFSFADRKIGVYACAEHEFSVASEALPGVNPFDPLWSLEHVSKLKETTDYIIVLYHGGKEHYRYPSPMLQKVCRRFVDKGANLVVCQHSHCIGCEEKYKDGTIVYGQGNFLFDDSDDECWQTSLLISIDNNLSISYIPLVKTGNGVRIAREQKGQEIMEGFLIRSKEILKPGFVDQQYRAFASSSLDFYLRALSGKQSALLRIINKLTGGRYMKWYLRGTYSQDNIVRISNYVDCEAHRELLSTALANEYKYR